MAADSLPMSNQLSDPLARKVNDGEALSEQGQDSSRYSLPQILRFEVIPSTYALLPLTQFAEVLKIPVGQVVPIPHMPNYVMGVYNWRGTVLWTIDLGLLLGMMPCHQYQGARSVHTTLVVEHRDESSTVHQLGMVIYDTVDILQIDPSELKAAALSNLPEHLTRFLSGYWVDANGEMLAVLNEQSVFEYMLSGA